MVSERHPSRSTRASAVSRTTVRSTLFGDTTADYSL
jgi:hypothetical protein